MLTISRLLVFPISYDARRNFYSTHLSKTNNQENNPSLRFAKDIIEKLTNTKSAELAAGTIPVISASLAYAQLLYAAKTISAGIFAGLIAH